MSSHTNIPTYPPEGLLFGEIFLILFKQEKHGYTLTFVIEEGRISLTEAQLYELIHYMEGGDHQVMGLSILMKDTGETKPITIIKADNNETVIYLGVPRRPVYRLCVLCTSSLRGVLKQILDFYTLRYTK